MSLLSRAYHFYLGMKKGFQLLLGSVNFYYRFIPETTALQATLYDFIVEVKKHDGPLQWISVTRAAFNACRRAFALSVDTSSTSIGAVIEQKDGENWRPLGFFSKNLQVHKQSTAHTIGSYLLLTSALIISSTSSKAVIPLCAQTTNSSCTCLRCKKARSTLTVRYATSHFCHITSTSSNTSTAQTTLSRRTVTSFSLLCILYSVSS